MDVNNNNIDFSEDSSDKSLVEKRLEWQRKHPKPWYLSTVKGLNKLKI